jgi:hypothetical protein
MDLRAMALVAAAITVERLRRPASASGAIGLLVIAAEVYLIVEPIP